MMRCGAFVLKFTTKKNSYIFDVNTNQIVRVSKAIFDVIDFCDPDHVSYEDSLKKLPPDLQKRRGIRRALREVKDLSTKYGLFSSRHPAEMKFFADSGQIRDMFSHEVNSLVLNVTENCNFRCKYCIFSGKYTYRRSHSNRSMTSDIALKSIDFLLKHSSKAKELVVTFYGGEPLLNFPVIKETVLYCKKVFKQPVLHSLTTNASLLDDEKIEFFRKNSIHLVLSMDGPRVMHDRFRRDVSGNGTFQQTLNVIKKIHSIDPQYYYSHISFSSVIPHPLWFKEFYGYVKDNSLFVNNSIRLSSIEYEDSIHSPDDFVPDNIDGKCLMKENEYMREVLRLFNSKNKALHPIFEDQLHLRLKTFHERCSHILGRIVPANGLCLPGMRKLFINVDGSFSICERVPDYNIGNIADGIKFDRVCELINKYIAVSKNCLDCPGVRFCFLCFQHALRKDIDGERKKLFCKYERADFKRTLALYSSILERNPNALNFLTKAG